MRWQLFAAAGPLILGVAASFSGIQSQTVAAVLLVIATVWGVLLAMSWVLEFRSPVVWRHRRPQETDAPVYDPRAASLAEMKRALGGLLIEMEHNEQLDWRDMMSIRQENLFAVAARLDYDPHDLGTPDLRRMVYELQTAADRWRSAYGEQNEAARPVEGYRAAAERARPVIEAYLDAN